MERGGCRRRGCRLRRLRVPACSTQCRWQQRGARWSVASRDCESPCATWGLTASCTPRQQCLGVLRVQGISPGIPLCGRRDRPQPLSATSLPAGSWLRPSWGTSCPCGGLPGAAAPQCRVEPCGFAPPRAWQARSREQEQRCWLQALQGHCHGWLWLWIFPCCRRALKTFEDENPSLSGGFFSWDADKGLFSSPTVPTPCRSFVCRCCLGVCCGRDGSLVTARAPQGSRAPGCRGLGERESSRKCERCVPEAETGSV